MKKPIGMGEVPNIRGGAGDAIRNIPVYILIAMNQIEKDYNAAVGQSN